MAIEGFVKFLDVAARFASFARISANVGIAANALNVLGQVALATENQAKVIALLDALEKEGKDVSSLVNQDGMLNNTELGRFGLVALKNYNVIIGVGDPIPSADTVKTWREQAGFIEAERAVATRSSGFRVTSGEAVATQEVRNETAVNPLAGVDLEAHVASAAAMADKVETDAAGTVADPN
ncbi:MAG: hypothetical protein LBJ25_03040 [Candidatus Margulisbacteria bacterium]|jgi:hypothetical protein|nr:hypothetical protein [Candidatus Margulisiibacteriota bacterium]